MMACISASCTRRKGGGGGQGSGRRGQVRGAGCSAGTEKARRGEDLARAVPKLWAAFLGLLCAAWSCPCPCLCHREAPIEKRGQVGAADGGLDSPGWPSAPPHPEPAHVAGWTAPAAAPSGPPPRSTCGSEGCGARCRSGMGWEPQQGEATPPQAGIFPQSRSHNCQN